MKTLLTILLLIPSLSWGFDTTIQCNYEAQTLIEKGYEEKYNGNFIIKLKEADKNKKPLPTFTSELIGHRYCSNKEFTGIYTEETFKFDCYKLEGRSIRFVIDRYSGYLDEYIMDTSTKELLVNRFAVCEKAERKF